MVPLETPARAAMSWSRALARPHSPKTSRGALMICSGRSAGHLRHFGAAGFARGISYAKVSDQSVIYTDPSPAVNNDGALPLLVGLCRFPVPVMRVRHHHDRRQKEEQRDGAEDQSGQCSAQVRLLFGCHGYFAPGSLETLAFDTVSF